MIHIESTPEVGYAFALASHELQQHQFQEFLIETGYSWKGGLTSDSARAQHPQTELSWYDCAAFCNWLSRREGLEEVYQPNEAGQYAEGMRIAPDALTRNGYRLPTGQEWELGCRAGTVGRHYFGDSNFWAQSYAWFHPMAKDELQAVARLRPNDLGLFDTLGNAGEWILESEDNQPLDTAVSDRVPRVHRGGSFEQKVQELTATAARTAGPAERLPMVGMRLARAIR